jgi:hypothetical protein
VVADPAVVALPAVVAEVAVEALGVVVAVLAEVVNKLVHRVVKTSKSQPV